MTAYFDILFGEKSQNDKNCISNPKLKEHKNHLVKVSSYKQYHRINDYKGLGSCAID